MTKLSGKLPVGDANGLDVLRTQLVKEPLAKHVVVAIIDCERLITDTDTGSVEPVVRVRRIEVVEDDLDVLHNLLQRALEKRTGLVSLPFELEQDVRAAFEGIQLDLPVEQDQPVEPATGDEPPPDEESK